MRSASSLAPRRVAHCLSVVLIACLYAGPVASASGSTLTVKLYPQQIGSCDQASTDPEVERVLSVKQVPATPCPMLEPTSGSLRQDEHYELKDSLPGYLPKAGGTITGKIVFAQAGAASPLPGYVDANVTLEVNSQS